MPAATRRFPAPWTIDEMPACFVVRDREGQAMAYVYYEEEAGRRMAMRRLTRDEAFLLAVNYRVTARFSQPGGQNCIGVARSED
jgi:hypothetical protein